MWPPYNNLREKLSTDTGIISQTTATKSFGLKVLNPIWYPILLSYFEKTPGTTPTIFLWTYASKEVLTENCINKSSGMNGILAVVFTLAGNISII